MMSERNELEQMLSDELKLVSAFPDAECDKLARLICEKLQESKAVFTEHLDAEFDARERQAEATASLMEEWAKVPPGRYSF